MKQLTGLGRPVRERTYVPNAHGTDGYREQAHLVTRVDLLEDGADTHLKVFSRGFAICVGHLHLPASDAEAFLHRLFRDPPVTDREAIQVLMDELEEAYAAGDDKRRMRARRHIQRTLFAMAADLHLIEGLPPEDPHAFDTTTELGPGERAEATPSTPNTAGAAVPVAAPESSEAEES